MTIPAKLHAIAQSNGYLLDYRPRVKVRGWPQDSAKPFHLRYSDDSFLSSFATLDALERALRARAGL
jgi:hypothetical protein